MTLLLIEGFDHLNGILLARKDWVFSQSATGGLAPASVTGRLAGYAMRLQGANTNTSTFTKTFAGAGSTTVVGFAFLYDAVHTTDTFFGVTGQWAFHVNSANQTPYITDAAGATVITTTTIAQAGVWNYFEVKCFKGAVSGTCALRMNNVVLGSATSNFGASNATSIYFQERDNTRYIQVDDVYVLDTAGSAPQNDYLGDVRVETLMPTGVGTTSDWTKNGGTANWDRVKEVTGTFPDDDTTYNAASVVGDKDTYAIADPSPTVGTVFGVQVNLGVRKTDAGVRTVKPVMRVGGVDYDGTTAYAPSTGYGNYADLQQQDPTATDWTIASVTAAEFGVKINT